MFKYFKFFKVMLTTMKYEEGIWCNACLNTFSFILFRWAIIFNIKKYKRRLNQWIQKVVCKTSKSQKVKFLTWVNVKCNLQASNNQTIFILTTITYGFAFAWWPPTCLGNKHANMLHVNALHYKLSSHFIPYYLSELHIILKIPLHIYF